MAIDDRIKQILAANDEDESDIREIFSFTNGTFVKAKFDSNGDYMIQTQYYNHFISPVAQTTIERFPNEADPLVYNRSLERLNRDRGSPINPKSINRINIGFAEALGNDPENIFVKDIVDYLGHNKGNILPVFGVKKALYDHLSDLLGEYGLRIPGRLVKGEKLLIKK